MPASFDTVIVGAGNAGVSLAARLRLDGRQHIALVDPSPVHRYRPMLNYAAAGTARMDRYERPMRAVVPDGVELVPHAATRIDPAARTVTLGSRAAPDSGPTLGYANLVLCPGLTPRWDAIPGLDLGYVDGWAVSAHVPDYVGRARAALVRVREGTVVFSVPPEPASCGGTVLKALFLACDHWRREGVLDRIDVHLVTPFGGLLGLEPTDSRLWPSLTRYGITVHARRHVTAVDHHARTVRLGGPGPGVGTDTDTDTDDPTATEIGDVTLAYVTPPSGAPRVIAESGLGDSTDAGLVEVDPLTLRHSRADAVWGLGDAATVGTRPSGGALRSQVAVVADDLRAGGPVTPYDGYTIVPVAVSRDRLMLAEHDRAGRPAPSVRGVDLTVPRRVTYLFDRYLQPVLYFRRLLRGRV